MEQALQTKERFDLHGLHFDSGAAKLQSNASAILNDIATALKNFPEWHLRIIGHTDSRGDLSHNETLSTERAKAVQAALLERGVNPQRLRVLFFVLLSACTVAALQTVGAVLVIAMVVTPGATAYLLTDRFSRMIWLAMLIGAATSAVGAYLSFFVDGATGGLIVTLQTLVFLGAFVFAPKHGRLAARRSSRATSGAPA
jgi:hypothetical protein